MFFNSFPINKLIYVYIYSLYIWALYRYTTYMYSFIFIHWAIHHNLDIVEILGNDGKDKDEKHITFKTKEE